MTGKTYNPERYTRKARRLAGHDYTRGVYFVTIRAQLHEPVFDIPLLRDILQRNWDALPARFPTVTLDEFIIMPDHVHFVLSLNGKTTDENSTRPRLGDVVGAYKSLTTVEWLDYIKSLNTSWPFPLWQYNYFELIIRDQQHLENTRQYIRANPSRLKQHATLSPELAQSISNPPRFFMKQNESIKENTDTDMFVHHMHVEE